MSDLSIKDKNIYLKREVKIKLAATCNINNRMDNRNVYWIHNHDYVVFGKVLLRSKAKG